ncbi:MAG: Mur ligase family protein, partial [Bacteroidota bacterium]|nr:Mur ligase family protein [Bacteroidota bacterium]
MDISKLYTIYRDSAGICHDSRKIMEGCIYWSIKGERLDGHDFVEEALQKGAALAVVSDAAFKSKEKCFHVGDTLKALQHLAAYHRRVLAIPVICIAGSNGKTTTKELMRNMLTEKFNTFATPGNLNNHIGQPLSILQLTGEHEMAVLELGANHPNENKELCDIAQPDYG